MKQAFLAILLTGSLAQAQPAQTKSDPTKVTSVSKAPAAKAPAAKAPAAAPDLLKPATLNRTAPATFRAKLTTTKGDVVIEVTRAWAPRGADRFYNLVRAGFYTDAPFFRVIGGFMAQFGISARPDVSKVWRDAKIADDPVTQSNTRGKLTFATAGPNTRTTQLFINYGNNANLDPMGFAPFGEVIQGMENVDKFYTGYGGSPDQDALQNGGKAWVDRNMPMVDRILTATIVPAAPAAAPAAPAAPKAPAAAKPPAATK